MEPLSLVFGLFAAFGALSALLGLLAVRQFARRPPADPQPPAAITLLKPLCGAEPELEAALATFCRQDHPVFQIVFGAQSIDDPAAAAVRRLRARFPAVDMTLVIDATPHGMNRKVANLLNMLPHARHDVLVFADSDLHVAPDYLRAIQTALDRPGVGLVTTLYVGRPAVAGWAAQLGASHLSHTFLPGALLSRLMGRQDCLGTTMALTRDTLRRVGGLEALSPHLADDNVLGRLVQGLGLSVTLADTVPVAAVQDRRLADLWSHELRWARTIGALAPWAYAGSSLQYPIVWAAAACLLSGFRPWSLLLLAACWCARALTARAIDRTLRSRIGQRVPPVAAWLLPAREILSVAEIIASYRGHKVVWRGHAMHADGGRITAVPGLGESLRVRARIAGAFLLALLAASAAVAQQPSQAQLNAVKQSCRADYQAHCASVPPGGSAALSCLKDNAASLSAGCQSALGGLSGSSPKASSTSPGTSNPSASAAPAARPPSRQQLAALRQACRADYRSFCQGVRPGGGAGLACLRDNAQQLSPGCQNALMSLRH